MWSIFRKFAISYPRNGSSPTPWRQSSTANWVQAISVAVIITLAGCSGPDSPSQPDAVLIRSDRQVVTLAQFERAFDAARIAYGDARSVDPGMIEEARLRLLNQMTEELIVDRRAGELNIVLDQEELERAIGQIKKDYPEGEFTQMLLESAIPFALWKDRLRVRLLMEKVVDYELGRTVAITAQEIEAYYKANAEEFAVMDENAPEMDLNRAIVDRLRREKVEAAYPQWMDGLRQRFGVEINWELWQQSRRSDMGSAGQEKGMAD